MPRRIQRIGFPGKQSDTVTFDFRPNDIGRIEKAYGHKLPKQVWKKIIFATSLFIASASEERTAVPIKPLLAQLRKLRSAAYSIRTQLDETPTASLVNYPARRSRPIVNSKMICVVLDDTIHLRMFERNPNYSLETEKSLIWGFETLSAIERKYFQREESNPAFYYDSLFPLLVHTLDALTAVCDFVSYEISDPEYQGYREGWPWEIWIWWLSIIMREHELPYQVRKDLRKAGQVKSPFVMFVRELQKQLPTEMQRFEQSADALGQAINRARKGYNLNCSFSETVQIDESKWPELSELIREFG